MAHFVFRLERVLRYREYLEKQARQKLRRSREACAYKEKTLIDVKSQRKSAAERCEKEVVQVVSTARYLLYQRYIDQLSMDAEEAKQGLESAKQEVKAMENEWRRASSNKKSLEALKERQSGVHGEMLKAEEQKFLDELVILRRRQLT